MFFDDDDEVKPRHLSSGKCLCQFIEEHFDNNSNVNDDQISLKGLSIKNGVFKRVKTKKKKSKMKDDEEAEQKRVEEAAVCVEIFEESKRTRLQQAASAAVAATKEPNGISSLVSTNGVFHLRTEFLSQDNCKEELINRLRSLLETRIGEVDSRNLCEVQ